MNINVETITSEPVSITEAKTYLGLDTSDHDALIGELVTAARDWYEGTTQRLVEQRAVTLELHAQETKSPIRLPYGPIVTITSVKYWDDSAGDWSSAIASTNYRVVNLDPPLIESDGEGWTTEVTRKALQIVYECGASPSMIAKETMMDYLSRLYDGRGAAKDTGDMEKRIRQREGVNPFGVVFS